MLHQQPPSSHGHPICRSVTTPNESQQHGVDLTSDDVDSRDDVDDIDRLRKSYIASLDASIDLLMRNSIGSNLPAMSALIGLPQHLAPQRHSATTTSPSGMFHWYQPPTSEADKPDVPIAPTNTRSTQFTIENIIRKE